MPNETNRPLEVRCTDCRFTQTVGPDDDRSPADVIVDHGQETGHKLTTGEPDG